MNKILIEKIGAALANLEEIQGSARPTLMGGRKASGDYKYEKNDVERAMASFMAMADEFYSETDRIKQSTDSSVQDYINFRFEFIDYCAGTTGIQGGDQK